MNILKNRSVLLLLTRLFQENGEGEALRKLFASVDTDTATDAELRALYGALNSYLIRWLMKESLSNWN